MKLGHSVGVVVRQDSTKVLTETIAGQSKQIGMVVARLLASLTTDNNEAVIV